MKLVLEIISLVISTILFCKVVFRYILKNNFNILHFVYVLFYLVQSLPIFQQLIMGVDDDIVRYGITYDAMNNDYVDIIYSFFIIITSLLIYFFAIKLNKVKIIKNTNNESIGDKVKNTKLFKNPKLKSLLIIGMFICLPFILFAPNLKAYTTFAYFFSNSISSNTSEYIYHFKFIAKLNLIPFLCTIIYYLINENKKNNIIIIISAILFTWISQKRTLILFFMIVVLFIDFFVKDIDKKKIIKKAILLFSLEVLYFIIYKNLTLKGSNHTFNWLYTFYFSRLVNVKVSIYDYFIDRNMLDYIGQSFLADFLWFIPRKIWITKPYPYDNFYTAFVFGKELLEIDWDFQVNSWTEFISNFGIFGPIMNTYFFYIIAKISELSKSLYIYIFGCFFILLYCVFGCTGIVEYCFTIFIALLFIKKFRLKKKLEKDDYEIK